MPSRWRCNPRGRIPPESNPSWASLRSIRQLLGVSLPFEVEHGARASASTDCGCRHPSPCKHRFLLVSSGRCPGGRFRMRAPVLTVVAVFALGLYSAPALLQSRGGGSGVHGGEDETGPYDLVRNWPHPFARSGYISGSQGGVFAESPDRIFLLNRGELKLPDRVPADFTGAWGFLGAAIDPAPEIRNCIVVVDGEGRMIESWTQWDRLFQGGRGPHSIHISPYDPERNVWVI